MEKLPFTSHMHTQPRLRILLVWENALCYVRILNYGIQTILGTLPACYKANHFLSWGISPAFHVSMAYLPLNLVMFLVAVGLGMILSGELPQPSSDTPPSYLLFSLASSVLLASRLVPNGSLSIL